MTKQKIELGVVHYLDGEYGVWFEGFLDPVHVKSTSFRQAAIKVSAASKIMNAEFHFNGEKVYESAAVNTEGSAPTPGQRTARIVYRYNEEGRTLLRFFDNETGEDFTREIDSGNDMPDGWLFYSNIKVSPGDICKFFSAGGSYCSIGKLGYAVGRVDPSEQANHIYDTPEYRALKRRFEEALEQTRKAIQERDEYKKLWEQAGEVIGTRSNEYYEAKAELENAKTIISNLRLRNDELRHRRGVAVAPVRHGQAVYCCDGAANNLIKELTRNLEEAREENRKLQQHSDNQFDTLQNIVRVVNGEPAS